MPMPSSKLNHGIMAQYNFEGDIENITPRQLEFINKVIDEQGFTGSKVIIQPVGIAGDNYVASVKRITLEGENGNLSIIAKIAPTSEIIRKKMNSYILFRNEHFMYTEVLPKLVQLQRNAEIPEEEHLKFAKCYGSLVEETNEVILLEDLKTGDFAMLDRFESLSDDCVKSVLKNFAILHSLSYVLKRNEPEIYNHYKDNLFDMWGAMAGAEETKAAFQQIEDSTLEMVDNPEHKNIIRHKIVNVGEQAAKMSKIEDGNKYAVIQQGDAWTNNVMFRFEDGKLQQSIMIDYQVSKNSNPAVDLLYMIFNCTDHETRVKHFYDWIDYYHTELEKSLSNYGLKANYVYPRDQLDADMKRYGKLLFGLSVILTTVLTMTPEDATKMKEAMAQSDTEAKDGIKISNFHNESLVRLKTRLLGLIESFTQFGLLS